MFAVATDELQVQLLHPAARRARAHARRRRGVRPALRRGLLARSRRAGDGADRRRGRAAAGDVPGSCCRAPGSRARHGHLVRQRARADRPELPRRAPRGAGQPRRRAASPASPATGSRSCCWCRSWRRSTRVVDELPAVGRRPRHRAASAPRAASRAVDRVAVVALGHDRGQARADADALGGVLALEVAGDVVQLGQRLALGERDEQLDVAAACARTRRAIALAELVEPLAGDGRDEHGLGVAEARARGGARRRAGRPC